MKIIVAGCGKMGDSIIRDLVAEGHDVTAIDVKENVISKISNTYDVMTVCGNCMDFSTLEESGVADARLFISMTPKDEINILSCFLARRMGAHHTIARVEDPDRDEKELAFIKQQTNISMFISPSMLVAGELNNMLKLPSGVRAEYFARHSFEMIEFKVKDGSSLDNMSVVDIRRRYKENFLICAVRRGSEVFIPGGDFVLKSGDTIIMNAAPDEINRLLYDIGSVSNRVTSVMILGGSRTALHLGRMLISGGVKVKIIERDRERCRALCEALPEAVIINGDGAQRDLLYEEGLPTTDAFVSLSGIDEENILMCIYASNENVPKTMCKVDREEFIDLAGKLGVDSLVSPAQRVSNVVVRYARAVENAKGSKVETMYRLMDSKAEAVEFAVSPEFRQIGVPLKDLHFKSGILVGGILREGRILIPSGADSIQAGDRVIIVATSQHQLYDLSDTLAEA